METLASRLAHAMTERGRKITPLAEAAGMTYQGVKKILDGKTATIKADSLFPMANYLKVDPTWLSTGEGTMEVRGSLTRVDSHPPSGAHTPADHLRALVEVFASAPDSTRDTVAMLAAGAIKNPDTLPDCVRAIEALAAYSAAKGPPTESKQFHPPVPTAVTPRHATEPHTHHPGT